jgi:RNA polymerase sigma factor (sigma-70 family)
MLGGPGRVIVGELKRYFRDCGSMIRLPSRLHDRYRLVYGYEFTEWHLDLCAAVTHLSDREKDLLTLRYYRNLTQTEIAAEMGLSQMQISRLLAATIDKLRTHLLSPILTAP